MVGIEMYVIISQHFRQTLIQTSASYPTFMQGIGRLSHDVGYHSRHIVELQEENHLLLS